MRFRILFCITCILFCQCTNNSDSDSNICEIAAAKYDSFSKYSYHIGTTPNKIPGIVGTGFVLKYHTRIYFISALHCFTGMDIHGNAGLINGVQSQPTFFNLSEIDNNKKWWRKKFDLYIGGKPLFYWDTPKDSLCDIGALDVTDSVPLPQNIMTFEETWLTENIAIGDSIFYWGYPVIMDNQSTIQKFYCGTISNASYWDNNAMLGNIESFEGCSGSPIFKVKKDKIILIGLMHGGKTTDNSKEVALFKKGFIELNLPK